jgi:two-component system, OmpR family, sensor kinase
MDAIARARDAATSAREALRTVQARVIASYLLLLTLGTVISVLAIRELLLVRLDDRVEQDLRQEVDEFQRLARDGVDPATGEPFGDDVQRLFTVYLQRNVPGGAEELLTVPRRGAPRYRYSEQAEEAVLADDLGGPLTARWRRLREVESGEIDTHAGPARYVAVPVIQGGESLGSFVVANFIAAERAEVDDAVRIVAAVSGGVLLLGTLLAFLSVGRVLAPLRSLRDTARSIEASDLTRRIEVEGRDELAELARTFNAMIDRLELAFDSQRQFLRDAGHELRTPLTIVRGHLELLLREPERLPETVDLVTDEIDRMSRFVDDLLLLAKLEQPDFLQLQTVDIGELTTELVAKAEQLAPRRWRLDGVSRRRVVADPQRLTQAVMNLADNAVRQTAEGDEIALGSAVNGRWARLWVRDSGPGVAPVERDRIFGRFERGRHARYDGSGLGLAIVRAVAEAHGGRVELRSEPDAGARFDVVVPVDPEPEVVSTAERSER